MRWAVLLLFVACSSSPSTDDDDGPTDEVTDDALDPDAVDEYAGQDLTLPEHTMRPTFQSIGIYWDAAPAPLDADDVDARVQYRALGEAAWSEAMPLWYDGRDAQYRGSILHLAPGEEYEVKLTHDGGGYRIARTATWSEELPIARTVIVESSATTLEITEGGTPDGYVLYTGPATIDVAKGADFNVVVKAKYVILRGLTLRGARHSGILLGDGTSSNDFDVTDVVIEDSDISGWGTLATNDPDCVASHPGAKQFGLNMQSAVFSRSTKLERVVIQRNRLHHPSTSANSWKEYNCHGNTFHPEGPQAISFFGAEGHHVIRYNEIDSDAEHYFNDSMGEFANFSTRGFPNRDTDIHGNLIRRCWDDGLELEGADMNVRVWGNYIDQTYIKVALAAVSKGPIYVVGNVGGSSRTSPVDAYGQGFIKSRNVGSGDYVGGGRVYLINNTVWKSATGSLVSAFVSEFNEENRIDNYRVFNNVIQVYQPDEKYGLREAHAVNSQFDHDVVLGKTSFSSEQETHGALGTPTFSGTGFDEATSTGTFYLAADGLGAGTGRAFPNLTPPEPVDAGAH